MTDSEPEGAASTRPGDIRHDSWPVEGYEGAGEQDVAYVGMADPVAGTDRRTALLYDADREAILEADVVDEEGRFVPREDDERLLGASETIGDVLRELGDRLDSDSLSAFARDHVDTDDHDRQTDRNVSLESATFTPASVAENAEHDYEFSGSITVDDPDDRTLIFNRSFLVHLSEDRPRAVVDVTERTLRPEAGSAERGGDANIVAERETSFSIDLAEVDAEQHIDAKIEQACRDWHETHIEPVS